MSPNNCDKSTALRHLCRSGVIALVVSISCAPAHDQQPPVTNSATEAQSASPELVDGVSIQLTLANDASPENIVIDVSIANHRNTDVTFDEILSAFFEWQLFDGNGKRVEQLVQADHEMNVGDTARFVSLKPGETKQLQVNLSHGVLQMQADEDSAALPNGEVAHFPIWIERLVSFSLPDDEQQYSAKLVYVTDASQSLAFERFFGKPPEDLNVFAGSSDSKFVEFGFPTKPAAGLR